MKFMQTHKVYLTPISPIHIGCGEDFEPTNYVIDENVLYHFDPVKLGLSQEQRERLINLIDDEKISNAQKLLNIQKFFLNYKDIAKKVSIHEANVATGFPFEWKEKISKPVEKDKKGKEKDVINQLAIQRNAYYPSKNGHIPYIAGSSFKGAFITPILSQRHFENGQSPFIKLDAKMNSKDKNKKLADIADKINNDYIYQINNLKSFEEVKEEFAHNEFRSIKFSDFTPEIVANTKIYYTVSFHRELYKGEKKSDSRIVQRRECILEGQYRAFTADLTIMEDRVNKLCSLEEYFKITQDYYRRAFTSEIEKMKESDLVNEKWANSILNLISKGGYLVRLGKNGSDTKVLEGKNVAQIKINPKKGQEEYYQEKATTFWLAADNNKQQKDLLPFGWAIIEVDPLGDNEALKQWCEAQNKPKFDRSTEILKREAQKTEEIAKQQAKLAEEKAKAEMLNSLSDNQRLVMDFVEKLNETRERQADNTGSPLLKEAEALINQATEWDITERQFVFEQITPDFLKSKIDFKKKDTEKNVKKWRNKLGIE